MKETEDNRFELAADSGQSILLPIENLIHVIRGQQVMLDSDLARLYEVKTKRLKEQVRRNLNRFPADFMFELTKEECLRPTSPLIQVYSLLDVYFFLLW